RQRPRVRATTRGHGTPRHPRHARTGPAARRTAARREPAGERHADHGAHSTGSGRPDMIRILLIDDHPIVRQGLASALEDEADFQVAGAAGSAEEAILLVARLRPDVVLLDL